MPWLILAIVTLLLTAAPRGINQAIFDFVCVTVVFPVLIVVAMIFSPGRANAPLFQFLGLVSYPVDALHVPLAKWFSVALGNSGGSMASESWWIGIAFVALLLPLCWLLDKYDDMPIRPVALPALPVLSFRQRAR